jgi:hypothetical protein
MELHDIVAAVKALALELGKTPTRLEFESRVSGGHYALKKIGGYTIVLKAAGLDTYDERRIGNRAKITNDIFQKNLEAHLEAYEPVRRPPQTPWPKIAVMGDLHEPFGHAGVKQAFKQFVAEMKPDWIVQVGDAVDMYAHSKFPSSPNVYTPKQEEELARKNLEVFWKGCQEAAPKAKCVMLLGNHAVRPIKRVLESVPSLEHWAEAYLKNLLAFPGVETVMDPREEYMIADIAFIHGFKGGLGVHRDHLMRNTVLGHLHVGSVTFRNLRDTTLWELNAGFAADPHSKGLTYTPSKTTGWTLGFGYIDKHGPRFIPYRDEAASVSQL